MEVQLLGPVELRFRGQIVSGWTPQQRSVLAALAVDAGRPVALDTLVDRVWGESAPAQARHAVYVHVAKIRRTFREAGTRAGLDRRSGGYLLDAPADWVDVHRFQALVALARDASSDESRAGLLGRALDLWQGVPLDAVPGHWAGRVREAWQHQRVTVATRWAGLAQRFADPDETIPRLVELLTEHPTAEPLMAALLRALHAAGRTGEAIDRFTAMRALLVDEFGTDPGAELAGAYQEILRGPAVTPNRDAAPGGREPGRTSTAPVGRPTPLPRGVRGFTGRAAELARLDDLTRTGGIVLLAGPAGVGKTALAAHWARAAAARFPDGRLWVNLRGFDPVDPCLPPAEAVRTLLRALGVPAERIPSDEERLAEAYHERTHGRRVLIVLDNARDAEQVRPLLPGSRGATVLVTTRRVLPGLVAAEGAYPLPIERMSTEDSRGLLEQRLGAARVAAEPEAVAELIARCVRLPLALAIVAARAEARPTFPLAALAAELRTGLDALDTGDGRTDPRAVFAASYRALGPAAATMFRRLGLHPGPHTTVAAAASLTGQEPAQAVRALTELTDAHLMAEPAPGRYVAHDLLRAYAVELAAEDPAPDRQAARQRLLDHYVHTAHAASTRQILNRRPVPPAPARPGVVVTPIDDHGAAMAWFAGELPALLAAFRLAVDTGFDAHAWQLAWALVPFLDFQGEWATLVANQRAALAAAARLGDRHAQAHAHRYLGLALTRLGRAADAPEHLERATELFGAVGDPAGQARARLDLAQTLDRLDRPREALGDADAALTLARAAGDRAAQARALNASGWLHTRLGNHPATVASCVQALALYRDHPDPPGEAATWDTLGCAQLRLGRRAEALTSLDRALRLHAATGQRYPEADTLQHLADAHDAAGDARAARRALGQALTILTELDHPDAGRIRDRLAADPDHPGRPRKEPVNR
jgi:DNA-binding SARP family transcriptional activator/tetratricopeptide (TPR) repeat protein